jgi:hypothetical protein
MGYTYFDASCLCAGETAFVFREKTFYSCETTRTGNFSRETSHTGAVSRMFIDILAVNTCFLQGRSHYKRRPLQGI